MSCQFIVSLETAPAVVPNTAVICFVSYAGFSNSLVTRHQSEVCTPSALLRAGSFGLGISTLRWPYPLHYRTAFAFSDILYPLRLPPSLRSGYHSPVGGGAHRAYPVDCCGDTLRLGWRLSPGGGFGCCCLRLPSDSRPTHHFGYGLSASLAASDSRDVHLFTYVQPSGASLVRPRLEASRLWPSSPGLRTKPLPAMHAWVGTPEHHRAYFS